MMSRIKAVAGNTTQSGSYAAMGDPCYAPVFAPRSRLDCTLRTLMLIVPIIGLFLFSWIPSIRCRLMQILFELRMCPRGNAEQGLDLGFDPNEWLGSHQLIQSVVLWEEANGTLRPHAQWTAAERGDLYQAFWKARLDEETEIPEAPAEARPESAGTSFGTWYPRDLAWRTFIAYVGQTLAAEHARRFPWSITTYSREALAVLLDSRSLFNYDARTNRYAVNDQVHGIVTPGDPVRTFRFLRDIVPAGASSRETVALLVDWCRANLIHFLDTVSIANCLNHWGYSGYPPVERMISGTTREHPHDTGHFTAGCHGTVGFLRAVLRTANLPVERVDACRHSLPHFVTDDLFLSHGDDPYNRAAFSSPLPPADQLLIDRSTYLRWFGPDVSSDQQCTNVGRRTTELALANPNSPYLLWTRCQDIGNGRSNADSDIYRNFRAFYSLAELEGMGLWRRLDDEIARRGGCGSIPPG